MCFAHRPISYFTRLYVGALEANRYHVMADYIRCAVEYAQGSSLGTRPLVQQLRPGVIKPLGLDWCSHLSEVCNKFSGAKCPSTGENDICRFKSGATKPVTICLC